MKEKKKGFDYFASLVNMAQFALEEAKYLKSVFENFNPEEIMISKEHFDNILKKMSDVLSKYEWQVMNLFLGGKSYVEIAKKLNKSEKSIDNALQRIKKKVEKNLSAKAEEI